MELEFESRSVCIALKLRLPVYIYHSAYTGFPGGSDAKESACNVGDLGSIPGLGRPLEEGMATHSSILAWRIPMRGAWRTAVHGVTKSWTPLSQLDDTDYTVSSIQCLYSNYCTLAAEMLMIVTCFNFTVTSKASNQHWPAFAVCLSSTGLSHLIRRTRL